METKESKVELTAENLKIVQDNYKSAVENLKSHLNYEMSNLQVKYMAFEELTSLVSDLSRLFFAKLQNMRVRDDNAKLETRQNALSLLKSFELNVIEKVVLL